MGMKTHLSVNRPQNVSISGAEINLTLEVVQHVPAEKQHFDKWACAEPWTCPFNGCGPKSFSESLGRNALRTIFQGSFGLRLTPKIPAAGEKKPLVHTIYFMPWKRQLDNTWPVLNELPFWLGHAFRPHATKPKERVCGKQWLQETSCVAFVAGAWK